MLKHLFPFMDADGNAAGAAENNDGGTEMAAQETSGVQSGADEPKTGMDVKSEAQQLADGIVRKRLKGLSREDLDLLKEHKDEFAQFLDAKKTAEQRIAEAQQKADKALADAEKRRTKADAMIAAAGNGIKQEHIEDAVILAMAKAGDDTTIEQAIAQIAQANPSWKVGATELPKGGSNPATEANNELFKIKRHF